MADNIKLKPAWPHFGGKTTIMPAVWQRLGDPLNLVDAFAGSGSTLWTRPYWSVEEARFVVGRPYRTETINELNPFIANFYRAVHADPEQVARYADWPVSECDLHARHLWLISQSDFRERMLTDPDYFDAKIAGWWVWGACAWIGSGWCSTEYNQNSGLKTNGDVRRKLPLLGERPSGSGLLTLRRQQVKRQRPQLRPAQGVQAMRPPSRQLPSLRGDSGAVGNGIHAMRTPGRQLPAVGGRRGAPGIFGKSIEGGVLAFILALSDRLRNVRITCGDWSRVTGKSVTWKIGLSAVILDPPYNSDAERAAGLYAYDDLEVSTAVRQYALENGDNPKMRIALFGYTREHSQYMPDSWECLRWTTGGGYSNQNKNGNDNPEQECVWFSPYCLRPLDEPMQAIKDDRDYSDLFTRAGQ